jgi:hypothetical protein
LDAALRTLKRAPTILTVTPTEVVSDAAPVYPEVRVTGDHLAGPPANVLVRIRSNRAIK